jgi:hypothetical protein
MKVGPKKFDTPPEIFGMCAPEDNVTNWYYKGNIMQDF